MIKTGHNKDMKDTDKIRAIHLRVDSDLQAEALERLGDIYSSSSKDYPLGYTLRMIPPMDRLMNPQHKDAFEELRIRQRNFMANMVTVQSWEVAALFSASTTISQTLHDLIMMMPSPNIPGSQLFHCADKNSAKAPCTFMVHPTDETHARAMVAGLIPYLRFQFRRKAFPGEKQFSKDENVFMAKHLYRFFTPDAVKRSMRCDWSAKDGGVTSREAESALDALKDNDHFKFATVEKVIVDTANIGEEALLPPAQYQQGESDSVPTFRVPGPLVRRTSAASLQPTTLSDGASTIETATKSKSHENKATSSVASKSSTTTGGSISTKGSKTSKTSKATSELTTSIDVMQANMTSMQQQFMQFMNKFDNMNNNMSAMSGRVDSLESNPGTKPRPPEKESGHQP
jgi:hypothetical protein